MTAQTPSADQCVEQLKVLADPTRLQVLRALMAGPQHVGTLNEKISIPQNLLSHHLRKLREAGLVEAERDGKSVLYSLVSGVRTRTKQPAIDLGCCKISFEDS